MGNLSEEVELQISYNKIKMREVKGGAKLNNIPLTREHTLESFGFHTSNRISGDAVSDTYNSQFPLCYPFVKWAGGKRQIVPQLYALAPPEFDRYFEPFLGGGALFFHLISNKSRQFTAYISDINSELINSHIAIRDNIEKLIILLTQHEIEYNKASEEYCYDLRDNCRPTDNIERASKREHQKIH